MRAQQPARHGPVESSTPEHGRLPGATGRARVQAMVQTNTDVVVCAIDLHGGSDLVLHRGLENAALHNAELHVLTVAEPNFGRVKVPDDIDDPSLSGVDKAKLTKFVDAHVARYRKDHPGEADDVKVTLHVESGLPAEVIVAYAARVSADLIVMATHGRTGIRHLVLGSCAEKVVRSAGCPVLVVRAKSHG
jgi:nucleotide-binding universal stress UspA family protein